MKIVMLTICGLSVMMGGLVACNPLAQNPAGSGSKTEKESLSDSKSNVSKKIHGQWKAEIFGRKNSEAIGGTIVLGFTDTGILYSTVEQGGKRRSQEMGPYRLDSTQSPMRLEFENNDEKITTLIEFLDSGEMLLLFAMRSSGPLPASMPKEDADRFKKISDVATVPDGMLPKVSKIALRAKSIQSEAKTVVGSMNRATQAYFLENAKFPTSFSQLQLGIDSQSQNYQYEVRLIGNNGVHLLGTSKLAELKGYSGAVFVVQSGASDRTTVAVLCEATNPGVGDLAAPKLINNTPTCSEGTVGLQK